MSILRTLSAIRRAWAAQEGVAGIEFAVTFPILLLIVAASTDFGEALMARRKIDDAAASMAAFFADQNQWTEREVEDLLAGGRFMMRPFETDALEIVLSVVRTSSEGEAKVVFSRAYGAPPLEVGSAPPVRLSPDVADRKSDIVLSEVRYALKTPFSKLWPLVATEGRFAFSSYHVARPRRSGRNAVHGEPIEPR